MDPYFSLVLFLLCIVVAVCIILWMALDDSKKYSLFLLNKSLPFVRKERLMSPNEAKLYSILKNLDVLKEFDIFPQVPYSSLMDIDSKTSDLGMRFDVINSYRSDFVITDKLSSSFELVIELNDQSHFYNYKKARDLFVYSALSSVKIPYLILKTKDLVKPFQIEQSIKSLLSLK